ncbi:COG4315 family predicted lipoprotein [Sinomicrobium sp. M5D2P17]
MKKACFLLTAVVFTFYSCSSDDDSSSDPDPDPIENNIGLTENSEHGTILTDSEGKTLYFFSDDAREASTCTAGCLSVWPVFYAEDITVDEGLDADDFTIITREDGEKQTTYKGWPLYYFANDSDTGDVNGDGVNEIWYVAKPDYSLMYVHAQLVGHDGKNYIIDENGAYVEGDGDSFYITDAEGNTLYAFVPDTRDNNTYTNEDFSNDAIWPIFHIDLDRLPSILNADDFNTISVHGERDQLSYKGWPMYYFGQDEAKGDNKGISFPRPGLWPILNTESTEAPEATDEG